MWKYFVRKNQSTKNFKEKYIFIILSIKFV